MVCACYSTKKMGWRSHTTTCNCWKNTYTSNTKTGIFKKFIPFLKKAMRFKQRIKKVVSNFRNQQRALETKKERELATIEQQYSYLIQEDENLKQTNADSKNWHNYLVFWLVWLLAIYVGYVVFSALSIVYMILAAFLISMIMDASVVYLSKKITRGLAIALAYFFVILFLVLIAFIVAPFFFTQLAQALNLGLEQITKLQELLQTQSLTVIIDNNLGFLPISLKEFFIKDIFTPDAILSLQSALQNNISQIISTGTTYVTSLWSFAVKIVTSVFTTITQAIMMFVLAVFFSIEKEWVVRFLSSIAGSKKNHVYVKLQRMYAKLGLWIKGQIIVCAYVGVMVAIMFQLASWILWVHIPNIGTLAIIAGLMNFIPYVWAFIWMTIAFFVTVLAAGWKISLLVLGLYILVNQSENNILTPIIMNKTLGISALVIFICMLMWASLFWFMGVLLAVPIAVIISLAFEKEKK